MILRKNEMATNFDCQTHSLFITSTPFDHSVLIRTQLVIKSGEHQYAASFFLYVGSL